jgi:ferredoxin
MPRQIKTENCVQCEICIPACPVEAIIKINGKIQINPDECVDCATCWRVCPEKCIDGGYKQYLELQTQVQ